MQSGGMAYVENAGYAGVIHARLLLSLVAGREWVILTPDHDIDVEDLRPENPDFSLYFSIPDGSIPPGVPAGSVYSFDPMSAREYSNFMVLGRAERDRELLLRGLLVPVADPVAPVAADADAQEDMWVLAEYLDGHKMGEEVSPDAGCAREDQRCLIHLLDDAGKDHVVLAARVKQVELEEFCEERIRLARESVSKHGDDTIAADDVRTLSITYGANGERSRQFRDTVKEMRVVEFDDYPFTLRTCQDYLKAASEIPRLQSCRRTAVNTSFCPATRFCVELDLGAELCRMRGETFSPYLNWFCRRPGDPIELQS